MGGANCCADEVLTFQAKPGSEDAQALQDGYTACHVLQSTPGDGEVGPLMNAGYLEERLIEVQISRRNLTEKYGVDLKHDDGRLVVVRILDVGAIERSNRTAKSMIPPKETLNVGDVIVRVNNVCANDEEMIDEIDESTSSTLWVIRS